MSARAYKLHNIDTNDDASFNLSKQTRLMNFLFENYDIDSTDEGVITMPVQAILDVIESKDDLGLNNAQIDQFNDDIKGLDFKDSIEYWVS